MGKKVKLITVPEETWLELGKLKKFPERSSFNAVINYLLKIYYQEAEEEIEQEYTKRLLE